MTILEVLDIEIRQEKINTMNMIGKNEVKVFLVTDDMTVYIENSK